MLQQCGGPSWCDDGQTSAAVPSFGRDSNWLLMQAVTSSCPIFPPPSASSPGRDEYSEVCRGGLSTLRCARGMQFNERRGQRDERVNECGDDNCAVLWISWSSLSSSSLLCWGHSKQLRTFSFKCPAEKPVARLSYSDTQGVQQDRHMRSTMYCSFHCTLTRTSGYN